MNFQWHIFLSYFFKIPHHVINKINRKKGNKKLVSGTCGTKSVPSIAIYFSENKNKNKKLEHKYKK